MFSNNPLSIACQNNDIVKVRHLVEILSLDEVNEEDVNGCTPLHIAALNGNTQILQILLSNKYIDQTIKNREGCLAQDCAPKQLKFLFNEMSTIDEDNDSNEELIEWFDTYNNAHRIAYENHKHLKQWLTKVSFRRLVEEISIGYVDQIDFGSNKVDQKMLIKSYLNESIENNDPIPILRAYTEKTPFVTKLNQDLARNGSDFRFQLSFALSNNLSRDNDPPKGFGEYIFAAILSHHPKIDQYRHFTGTTYRGMLIKKCDLDQYQQGKFILTRTFLSSSIDQHIAKKFLTDNDKNINSHHRLITIYHIRNRSTAIDLHSISVYPDEKEILLIPFTTFKIIHVEKNFDDISYIELDQYQIDNNQNN